MQINFLNEYYKNRTTDQNATDLVNWFLEIENANVQAAYDTGGVQPQSGKYKVTAIPTPGLNTFNTSSGSVVRAAIRHKNIPYFVVDNTLYSYASNGTRTSKGTLNTSTGFVDIAATSNQIGIVDGTNLYNYNTDTSTFTVCTDPDIIAAPVSITAQDEFFLITFANSTQIQASELAQGTTWSALSFASKSGNGDYVIKLVSNNRFVWVLGEITSEVWYNDGSSTFSFAPYSNAFIEYGCSARGSVAKGNSSIYFLAQSATGGYMVVTSEGMQLKPVSTPAINYQIQQLTSISDAIAYCYQSSGHEFYVLTFPTDDMTFVYDISTKLWHARKSYVGSAYTRHLSNCYCFAYGKHLVGAYNSATIYDMNENSTSENGTAIQRQLVTPPAYAEGKKLYLDRLQIDTSTGMGSSLTCTLEVSFDSGHTYTDTYSNTFPDVGGRMFYTRLGMTQNAFVLRFTTTAIALPYLLGATAEVRKGNY